MLWTLIIKPIPMNTILLNAYVLLFRNKLSNAMWNSHEILEMGRSGSWMYALFLSNLFYKELVPLLLSIYLYVWISILLTQNDISEG